MAAEGRAAMVVDYRKAGDLSRSPRHLRSGRPSHAQRRRTLRRSRPPFGGAVAVRSGHLPHLVAGVSPMRRSRLVQEAPAWATRRYLLHGEHDSILGPENSMMVHALAGHGEVRTFPNADHLMSEVADEIVEIGRRMGAALASTNTQGASGLFHRRVRVEEPLQTGLDPSQPGGGIAQGPSNSMASRFSAPAPAGSIARGVGSARFRDRRRSPSSQHTRTVFAFQIEIDAP